MKTATIKSALAIICLFFTVSTLFSQSAVGMRIDVQGSRYSDQMWIFSVPTTTRGFDNGWDGYKMFGTSTRIPQLFAMEEIGNFQIDAVPDMNDTYIAFKAGQDSVYTLKFTIQNLAFHYQSLYIKDLENGAITDIFTAGATYTFNVKPTPAAVKRFVILTSLPVVEIDTIVPEQPVDTVVYDEPVVLPEVPKDTVVAELPNDTVAIVDTVVIIDTVAVETPKDSIVNARPIVLPAAPKDTVVAEIPNDTIAIVDTVAVETPKDSVVNARPIVLPAAPKDSVVAEVPNDAIAIVDNSKETLVNARPIVLPAAPKDSVEGNYQKDAIDENFGNKSIVVIDRNLKDANRPGYNRTVRSDISFTEKRIVDSKLTVKVTNAQLIVDNQGDLNGMLKVINATDGKCVREYKFGSNTTSYFDIDFSAGTYIVAAITQTQTFSKLFIVR